MVNPNAVVSRLLPLANERVPTDALRGEAGYSIALEDGRQVRLDPADPRSVQRMCLLAGISQHGIPVYLEVDLETSIITKLLIPTIACVIDVRPNADGSVEVHLHPSHARHMLSSDLPERDELVQALRSAQRTGQVMAVTKDDTNAIIDVRAFRPSPDDTDILLPPPPPKYTGFDWRHPLRSLRPLWYWHWWPWWWSWRHVSLARAQEI